MLRETHVRRIVQPIVLGNARIIHVSVSCTINLEYPQRKGQSASTNKK